MSRHDDTQWLKDCGFCGWLRDMKSGEIITEHGDKFPSASHARAYLSDLPIPRIPPDLRRI